MIERLRIVFVHIPKTGGTSVREAIKARQSFYKDKADFFCPKGMDLSIYHEVLLNKGKAFTFAFVRNPWDRAVSSYMHLCYYGDIDKEQCPTFRRFIELYCEGKLKKKSNSPAVQWHMIAQHKFIFGCQGQLVDFVGRFESLQDDFNLVCKKNNIEVFELPHMLRSNREDYRYYYDKDTEDLVAKLYSGDIDHFSYSF